MKQIKGTSVCGNIIVGNLFYFDNNGDVLPTEKTTNPQKELETFNNILKIAKEQLDDLYTKTLKTSGEEKASIFEVHKLMLEDQDYLDSINNYVLEDKENILQAIKKTSQKFSKIFAEMDDEYMKARASDVSDISQRLINIISNKNQNSTNLTQPAIILAKDLTPSQTMTFDQNKILGFALENGSLTSHTSILAKANGIPTIVNLKTISKDWHNKLAVLDAKNGLLIIDPDSDTLQIALKQVEEENLQKKLLENIKGTKTCTKDGKTLKLYANITNLEDIDKALNQDAEGIGLFRTEFIYLNSNTYPTEDELFHIYKQTLLKMGGKKVIFRTLDIGADKNAPYFNLPHEENPALGLRAIRLCLTRIDLFKTQLKALLKASIFGNMAVMFPMIISVKELKDSIKILNEVKQELTTQNIKFNNNIEIGIMIETPASALISDELAPLVDFFSIGTNDLTQYTCAIDRQNQNLNPFLDTHHKAVLKLIEMTIKNAHKNNKWVGICGELGSDLTLTETLLKFDIDELSVSPAMLLPLKQKIQSLDLSK